MAFEQTTSPTRIRRKEGKLIAYAMKPSTTVYEGDTVVIDPADSKVVAVAGSGQANYIYVGVAAETATSGPSGTTHVLVWQSGVFQFACNTAGNIAGRRAWIDFTNGNPRTVYVPASDPTSGRRLAVGRVVGADASGEALVKIDFDINSVLVAS